MKRLLTMLAASFPVLAGGVGHAENCQEASRVKMPSCVHEDVSRNTSNYARNVMHTYRNRCSSAITLNFDFYDSIDMKDRIETVEPGEFLFISARRRSFRLYCCPEYGSCG